MNPNQVNLPPAFGGPDATDLEHCDICGALIPWGDVAWGVMDSDGADQVMCDRCGKAFAAKMWP